ncbi:hypothetical protein Taro_005030 [Colocasia esculenta]|uniref:Uncharacterized protein n=1 Tax=Colocasia esculenta TaxID=4460 RepID=A0A843TLX1_COLES|nr:hypothetical protein [Colocasia esculenta]
MEAIMSEGIEADYATVDAISSDIMAEEHGHHNGRDDIRNGSDTTSTPEPGKATRASSNSKAFSKISFSSSREFASKRTREASGTVHDQPTHGDKPTTWYLCWPERGPRLIGFAPYIALSRDPQVLDHRGASVVYAGRIPFFTSAIYALSPGVISGYPPRLFGPGMAYRTDPVRSVLRPRLHKLCLRTAGPSTEQRARLLNNGLGYRTGNLLGTFRPRESMQPFAPSRRLPSTPTFVFPLYPSEGPFGFGPNRESPPYIWHRLWERHQPWLVDIPLTRTLAIGQRALASHAWARVIKPLLPTTKLPLVGVIDNGPTAGTPTVAQKVAELWGLVQQLVGICQGLQAQLARQPALIVPPSSKQQAESSRWRPLAPSARREQHVEQPQRSRRVPFARRTPERQANSPCRFAVVPPPPCSDVGTNTHASRREGSVHSDQELVRRLRRIANLERRMDAMIRKAEGRVLDDDLDFRSPFTAEILEARASPKLPLPSIAPYDGTTDPADHVHGFESHMMLHRALDALKSSVGGSNILGIVRHVLSPEARGADPVQAMVPRPPATLPHSDNKGLLRILHCRDAAPANRRPHSKPLRRAPDPSGIRDQICTLAKAASRPPTSLTGTPREDVAPSRSAGCFVVGMKASPLSSAHDHTRANLRGWGASVDAISSLLGLRAHQGLIRPLFDLSRRQGSDLNAACPRIQLKASEHVLAIKAFKGFRLHRRLSSLSIQVKAQCLPVEPTRRALQVRSEGQEKLCMSAKRASKGFIDLVVSAPYDEKRLNGHLGWSRAMLL